MAIPAVLAAIVLLGSCQLSARSVAAPAARLAALVAAADPPRGACLEQAQRGLGNTLFWAGLAVALAVACIWPRREPTEAKTGATA